MVFELQLGFPARAAKQGRKFEVGIQDGTIAVPGAHTDIERLYGDRATKNSLLLQPPVVAIWQLSADQRSSSGLEIEGVGCFERLEVSTDGITAETRLTDSGALQVTFDGFQHLSAGDLLSLRHRGFMTIHLALYYTSEKDETAVEVHEGLHVKEEDDWEVVRKLHALLATQYKQRQEFLSKVHAEQQRTGKTVPFAASGAASSALSTSAMLTTPQMSSSASSSSVASLSGRAQKAFHHIPPVQIEAMRLTEVPSLDSRAGGTILHASHTPLAAENPPILDSPKLSPERIWWTPKLDIVEHQLQTLTAHSDLEYEVRVLKMRILKQLMLQRAHELMGTTHSEAECLSYCRVFPRKWQVQVGDQHHAKQGDDVQNMLMRFADKPPSNSALKSAMLVMTMNILARGLSSGPAGEPEIRYVPAKPTIVHSYEAPATTRTRWGATTTVERVDMKQVMPFDTLYEGVNRPHRPTWIADHSPRMMGIPHEPLSPREQTPRRVLRLSGKDDGKFYGNVGFTSKDEDGSRKMKLHMDAHATVHAPDLGLQHAGGIFAGVGVQSFAGDHSALHANVHTDHQLHVDSLQAPLEAILGGGPHGARSVPLPGHLEFGNGPQRQSVTIDAEAIFGEHVSKNVTPRPQHPAFVKYNRQGQRLKLDSRMLAKPTVDLKESPSLIDFAAQVSFTMPSARGAKKDASKGNQVSDRSGNGNKHKAPANGTLPFGAPKLLSLPSSEFTSGTPRFSKTLNKNQVAVTSTKISHTSSGVPISVGIPHPLSSPAGAPVVAGAGGSTAGALTTKPGAPQWTKTKPVETPRNNVNHRGMYLEGAHKMSKNSSAGSEKTEELNGSVEDVAGEAEDGRVTPRIVEEIVDDEAPAPLARDPTAEIASPHFENEHAADFDLATSSVDESGEREERTIELEDELMGANIEVAEAEQENVEAAESSSTSNAPAEEMEINTFVADMLPSSGCESSQGEAPESIEAVALDQHETPLPATPRVVLSTPTIPMLSFSGPSFKNSSSSCSTSSHLQPFLVEQQPREVEGDHAMTLVTELEHRGDAEQLYVDSEDDRPHTAQTAGVTFRASALLKSARTNPWVKAKNHHKLPHTIHKLKNTHSVLVRSPKSPSFPAKPFAPDEIKIKKTEIQASSGVTHGPFTHDGECQTPFMHSNLLMGRNNFGNFQGRAGGSGGSQSPPVGGTKVPDPFVFGWELRKLKIVEEIMRTDPCVLALQECDQFHDFFKPFLAELGYQSMFCPKSNSVCLEHGFYADGVALFWKYKSFVLKERYRGLTPAGNPCVMAILEYFDGDVVDTAMHMASEESHHGGNVQLRNSSMPGESTSAQKKLQQRRTIMMANDEDADVRAEDLSTPVTPARVPVNFRNAFGSGVNSPFSRYHSQASLNFAVETDEEEASKIVSARMVKGADGKMSRRVIHYEPGYVPPRRTSAANKKLHGVSTNDILEDKHGEHSSAATTPRMMVPDVAGVIFGDASGVEGQFAKTPRLSHVEPTLPLASAMFAVTAENTHLRHSIGKVRALLPGGDTCDGLLSVLDSARQRPRAPLAIETPRDISLPDLLGIFKHSVNHLPHVPLNGLTAPPAAAPTASGPRQVQPQLAAPSTSASKPEEVNLASLAAKEKRKRERSRDFKMHKKEYILVCTTHLKAGMHDEIREHQVAATLEQMEVMRKAFEKEYGGRKLDGEIFLGDLNCNPYQGNAISGVLRSGFSSAYPLPASKRDVGVLGGDNASSCRVQKGKCPATAVNSKGRKMVSDYIFSTGLNCESRLWMPFSDDVGDDVELPAKGYPSDHFAIAAQLSFKKKDRRTIK
eukprot:g2423.t1